MTTKPTSATKLARKLATEGDAWDLANAVLEHLAALGVTMNSDRLAVLARCVAAGVAAVPCTACRADLVRYVHGQIDEMCAKHPAPRNCKAKPSGPLQ